MSFSAVLIANRGEIALRVIRSCRSLGLRSVAIHTDLDTAAPHVREADDAVRVPSYLDIDAVVAAARDAGAGAIHPGYGFLSERADLARAVEAAGLVLVGPSAAVMDQMGRKDAAREIAIAAGVPVVPSHDAAQGTDAMDFPVLVKAAAGGGGKGMRVVRSAGEYDDAVAAARREAAAAFGDDTMLVEKYVERGRHIEVQVLADAHGAVVHLFERDCSTQRRHQKVLEEAPAPTISEAVRRTVTESAVALARQVGYVNAGTVEFLVDEDAAEGGEPPGGGPPGVDGGAGGSPGGVPPGVYFLEMNTRLQVEHPVTELVVRVGDSDAPLDLVALQLAVAAGEPLPFGQQDVRLTGHAIEARVYAEDPFAGFLPQAGTATLVSWPERARVDAALESGQQVSTSYDPMLGKVIVRGPDREGARRAMLAALDDTAILGLTTNLGFLRALVAGDAFTDATIDTAWLDRTDVPAPGADVARVLAAAGYARQLANPADGPFRADGWRSAGPPGAVLVELDEVVRVERGEDEALLIGWPGREPVAVRTVSRSELSSATGAVDPFRPGSATAARQRVVAVVATVDGRRHEAVVAVHPHQIEVVHQGHRHVFTRPDVFGDQAVVAGDGSLAAPMPGTVLGVNVTEGTRVAAGEVLGVLEAMKMELALPAPFDGVVVRVGAAVGEQVALGDVLFLVEAAGEPVEPEATGEPVEPEGG